MARVVGDKTSQKCEQRWTAPLYTYVIYIYMFITGSKDVMWLNKGRDRRHDGYFVARLFTRFFEKAFEKQVIEWEDIRPRGGGAAFQCFIVKLLAVTCHPVIRHMWSWNLMISVIIILVVGLPIPVGKGWASFLFHKHKSHMCAHSLRLVSS